MMENKMQTINNLFEGNETVIICYSFKLEAKTGKIFIILKAISWLQNVMV